MVFDGSLLYMFLLHETVYLRSWKEPRTNQKYRKEPHIFLNWFCLTTIASYLLFKNISCFLRPSSLLCLLMLPKQKQYCPYRPKMLPLPHQRTTQPWGVLTHAKIANFNPGQDSQVMNNCEEEYILADPAPLTSSKSKAHGHKVIFIFATIHYKMANGLTIVHICSCSSSANNYKI